MDLTKIKKTVYKVLVDGNEKISIRFDEYCKSDGRAGRYFVKLLKILQLNWKYRVLRKDMDEGLDQLKMPESTITRLPSVEELIAKLERYDVVSFDIFDTLVFRAVNSPRDVFRLLESEWRIMGFAEKRVQAERRARERSGEITIYDIYEILSQELSIDKQEAIQKELDAEKKVCFANPYMKRVFDELNKKKKVVLISDMYLTKDMIRDLLYTCGFCVEKDQIFISCEHGKGKANGDLQEIVSRIYGCSKTYIHIGDNKNTDILASEGIGWDTFYYPNVNTVGAPYRRREMQTLASSFYKGLLNTKLHSGMFRQDRYYEFGYCYGGILAVGYCQYLDRLAATEKIDQFLFLARDGYVIKKIYDRFFGKVASEYIPFSRFASYQLTIDKTWREMLEHVVRPRLNMRPPEPVQKVLELSDLMFLEKYLEKYGVSGQERFVLSVYEKIEKIFEENIGEIKRNYQETIEAAKKYFTRHVKQNAKICVVDVGWQGTGAICLKYFLEELCGMQVKVCGALMGMVKSDTTEICLANRSMFSYLFSPHHNQKTYLCHAGKNSMISYRNMLVEILFTEDHPSFLKYEMDQNGNVILKYGAKENNQKILDHLQQGILDFSEDYLKYGRCFGDVLEICGQEAYIPIDSVAKARKMCMQLLGEYEIHIDPGVFKESDRQIYREAQRN